MEENRVAVVVIAVENQDCIMKLNEILHVYGPYIIGRVGMPYKERNISIITVAMDAPGDVISALSGKLGRLQGISTKTSYLKLTETV
ncbi:MAG: iron-only hydrogenase system regulator [Lachnospiraceae bacterium]